MCHGIITLRGRLGRNIGVTFGEGTTESQPVVGIDCRGNGSAGIVLGMRVGVVSECGLLPWEYTRRSYKQ